MLTVICFVTSSAVLQTFCLSLSIQFFGMVQLLDGGKQPLITLIGVSLKEFVALPLKQILFRFHCFIFPNVLFQFLYLLLTFERTTSQVRCTPGKDPESEPPMFDAEHETKRKEQLLKLYNRTPEQV